MTAALVAEADASNAPFLDEERQRVLDLVARRVTQVEDPSVILEAVETVPSPARMTYEEFLAWADEDTLAEWVDGEVIPMSPAGKTHQDIAGFLESLLRIFVGEHQLGVVLSAPFQMKLSRGREPDLLFVAADHLDRFRESYLDGPSDLVVEILSTESAGRDRGDKFYEYAQGGVPEYWLIDPETRWAELYQLEAGHYRTLLSGDTGEYHSRALPGFRLRVEWLWQKPLPPVLQVLRELGVL